MDVGELSANTWVEIVAPVADASRALAEAVQDPSASLVGVTIAVSDRNTLLLNDAAWRLFADTLNALPDLRVSTSVTEGPKPVRFLLGTSHPSSLKG